MKFSFQNSRNSSPNLSRAANLSNPLANSAGLKSGATRFAGVERVELLFYIEARNFFAELRWHVYVAWRKSCGRKLPQPAARTDGGNREDEKGWNARRKKEMAALARSN